MDLVANWVRDEESGVAHGRSGREFATLGLLALSLGLVALPPVVAVLALLGLIS